jgi:alpha-1,3-mannosyltransferase
MTKVFFTCNLIGVLCARSLHYQFYAWYAWQALFLTIKSKTHWAVKSVPRTLRGETERNDRVALLVIIELCWNVYPSTTPSSLALLAAHLVLLRLSYNAT